MKSFYDYLKIPETANQEEIVAAYRKRVVETHPDKGGDELEFMNVRKAYENLSDPDRRQAYDKWLQEKRREEERQNSYRRYQEEQARRKQEERAAAEREKARKIEQIKASLHPLVREILSEKCKNELLRYNILREFNNTLNNVTDLTPASRKNAAIAILRCLNSRVFYPGSISIDEVKFVEEKCAKIANSKSSGDNQIQKIAIAIAIFVCAVFAIALLMNIDTTPKQKGNVVSIEEDDDNLQFVNEPSTFDFKEMVNSGLLTRNIADDIQYLIYDKTSNLFFFVGEFYLKDLLKKVNNDDKYSIKIIKKNGAIQNVGLYSYKKDLETYHPLEFVAPSVYNTYNDNFKFVGVWKNDVILIDQDSNNQKEWNKVEKDYKGIEILHYDKDWKFYKFGISAIGIASEEGYKYVYANPSFASCRVDNYASGDVYFDHEDGSINDVEEEILEPYTETIFETGAQPYNYWGRGVYNKNSLSKLTIQNYSARDAVVLLCSKDGTVIRNNYIKQSTTYTMEYIPSGVYDIKVMYGNSWNIAKNNGEGFPMGGFMKDVSYSESPSDDPFNFTPTEDDNGISYPTYQITLHKVKNGNFRTKKINAREFFRGMKQ